MSVERVNNLAFRPIEHRDLELMHHWHHMPHVDRWWRQPLSQKEIQEKYANAIAGSSATRVFLILYAEQRIGWVQWYHWRDYRDHARALGASDDEAGLDLAIGDRESLGRGWGTASIQAFVHDIIFADADVNSCVVDPEVENQRSRNAFSNAGFKEVGQVTLPGESMTRCVMRKSRSGQLLLP